MPWTLTTPVAVGDLEDSALAEIKIVRLEQHANKKRLGLQLQYGNTVGEVWTPGYAPRAKQIDVQITATDYDDIIANSVPDVQTSDPADAVRYAQVGAVWVERTYYAVQRACYEWLNTNSIIDAGSVT